MAFSKYLARLRSGGPGATALLLALGHVAFWAVGVIDAAAEPKAPAELAVGIAFTAPDNSEPAQLRGWFEDALVRHLTAVHIQAVPRSPAETVDAWLKKAPITHLIEIKFEGIVEVASIWTWQATRIQNASRKDRSPEAIVRLPRITADEASRAVDAAAFKLVGEFMAKVGIAVPRLVYAACFTGDPYPKWNDAVKAKLQAAESDLPWKLPNRLKALLATQGFDVDGIPRHRVVQWCGSKGDPRKELDDEMAKAVLVIEGGTKPDGQDEINRFAIWLYFTQITPDGGRRGESMEFSIDGKRVDSIKAAEILADAERLFTAKWPDVVLRLFPSKRR